MTAKLPLIAAAALALAGCGSSRVYGPGTDAVDVLGLQTARDNGTLTAQVQIQNPDDEPLQLRYRFTWVDGLGRPVGQGSPTDTLQTLSLAPLERRYISAPAPSADCADFQIYLQEWELD